MNILTSKRNAFTLVEILVSFVIISVISGMVAFALSGAQRQAQDTRARAMIDRLNLTILRVYEEESRRRVALGPNVASGQAASQSQLIYKRDWLRAVLPNNRADMDVGSNRPGAPAVSNIPYLQTTGVSSVVEGSRFAASERFRQRVQRTLGVNNWTAAYNAWTTENESAECLYQIFASTTLDGEPLLQQLRTRDIADTDEDGMPEIVDPWGVPVLWMRWPAGFYLKTRWVVDESNQNTWPTVGELRSNMQRMGDDPMDLLRMDPRNKSTYDDAAAENLPVNPLVNDPNRTVDKRTYFVRPLIVSAGADGEFDLVLGGPGTGRDTVADDEVNLPRIEDPPLPVTNTTSLTGPRFFPDPFFTLSLLNSGNGNNADGPRPLLERLGAVTDVNGDRTDNSADNIYPVLGF